MDLKHYTQTDIKDKKVLLRLDLDVAVNDQNDLRLERAVMTIRELLSFGVKQVVMIGHRGRPNGKFDADFSLAPVKDKLELLLNKAGVQLKINLVGLEVADSKPNDVLVMLENLRFYPGEKNNDQNFARALSAWGEIYVNDAFGNNHRSHASMVAVTKFLPSYAGPGLAREIEELTKFINSAPRPYVVILGGAKIETKIPLIKQLLAKADAILVGGALANTILGSRGVNVGQSLVTADYFSEAKSLDGPKLVLPIDAVTADGKIKGINELKAGDFIGDIGPATVTLFKQKIKEAKAILWNGPMGKFEEEPYQAGTSGIVDAIVNSRAATITGGGDTLDVLSRLNVIDKFSFVSVGGGAMLAFLAGETMPALEALK